MKPLALAAMIAIAVPTATANAEEAAAVQPDFSNVGSLDAAKALAGQGKLVPVLLFPAELGGEDIPENTVYITPQAAAARELAVDQIIKLLQDDSVNKVAVEPSYKGKSVVPASITMKAYHSEKAGRFEPTIKVW